MPLIRPATALRATRCALSSSTSTPIPNPKTTTPKTALAVTKSTTCDFSSSTKAQSADADHHEDHYDPPSGWLWGIKPGEKAEKEGWENIWIYGFFGSMGAGVVAYAFKPDTSIQTWALEEARRRLEAEGILKEPESK